MLWTIDSFSLVEVVTLKPSPPSPLFSISSISSTMLETASSQ